MRIAIALQITLTFVIGGSTRSATAQQPEIEVLVGNLQPGRSDQPQSPLTSPFGVDLDAKGNLFIVELAGGRVHRLDPEGRLQRIAGRTEKGYAGDGGPASQAVFNGMHNVAATPGGDLYIADSWNHCVRKIDGKTGIISTIAGTGEPGFSGDGGPATRAKFDYLMCVTLNANNDKLYVADLKNRRIRMVDLPGGTVSTVAGNGQRGVCTDGALATESPLVDPRAVTVDSQNRVYVLERSGHALRLVTPDGKIRTVAGTGDRGFRDGPALSAQFGAPKHLCVDARDNVYIADDQNARIRKYDPRSRTVTTVVGGETTPSIQLSRPHGVCVEQNDLYVVDTGHDRILRLRLAPR